ncbi:hypothetical protein WDW86_11745 [Bdellovibrionota bacterium FG-2]
MTLTISDLALLGLGASQEALRIFKSIPPDDVSASLAIAIALIYTNRWDFESNLVSVNAIGP